MNKPRFSYRDNFRFSTDKMLRWSIKIPQRIMGWPRKWAKWYRRWQEKNR